MTEAEIHAHSWWCPHCLKDVPPEMVTKDGEHYMESGGCGRSVRAEPLAAPPALQQQEEPREVDGDGPIRDGWQISIGPGHDGFGVYAHMTDYPEEGAVCICTIDPAEYPAASPSPQDFTLPMVEEGKGADAPKGRPCRTDPSKECVFGPCHFGGPCHIEAERNAGVAVDRHDPTSPRTTDGGAA